MKKKENREEVSCKTECCCLLLKLSRLNRVAPNIFDLVDGIICILAYPPVLKNVLSFLVEISIECWNFDFGLQFEEITQSRRHYHHCLGYVDQTETGINNL